MLFFFKFIFIIIKITCTKLSMHGSHTLYHSFKKKIIFPIRLHIYNYHEILFILAHFPPIAKPCSFPPIVFVVVTKSKNTNTT